MRSKFPSNRLPSGPLVLDASGVINFLGTGIPKELFTCLDRSILVAPDALREVRYHPIAGVELQAVLPILQTSGLLKVAALNAEAMEIFRDLVSGEIETGLDDGEAATIALAVTVADSAIVGLDERKATRIFRGRWPDRPLVDTVTLLAEIEAMGVIAPTAFANACFSALLHARMRVPVEAADWLAGIVGPERVEQCVTLTRHRRQRR